MRSFVSHCTSSTPSSSTSCFSSKIIPYLSVFNLRWVLESLLDEERAIARFGRTFTQDEVFNFKGKSLPDVPFGKWERVERV